MTNLNCDEIIDYGLNHDDKTVRELARRFQDYREAALHSIGGMKPVFSSANSYEPLHPGPDGSLIVVWAMSTPIKES